MGRCLCSVPWRGDDCGILGLAPRITPMSLQTITEGSNFDIVMTTSEVCSTLNLHVPSRIAYSQNNNIYLVMSMTGLFMGVVSTGFAFQTLAAIKREAD